MAIEINVPDIGADEVEITEILVKVGDKVEAEQSLITVEGDKASMEVPSPQAGIVKEIKVSVGDKTETGKLIMRWVQRSTWLKCSTRLSRLLTKISLKSSPNASARNST